MNEESGAWVQCREEDQLVTEDLFSTLHRSVKNLGSVGNLQIRDSLTVLNCGANYKCYEPFCCNFSRMAYSVELVLKFKNYIRLLLYQDLGKITVLFCDFFHPSANEPQPITAEKVVPQLRGLYVVAI